MKNFNPKVSIVIPVYNGSKYLGEAIDSALAQTYKNLEVIVANDGSDDNGATEKVARSYGDKIIYLHQNENGGAATVLNLAIRHMTGEYFSWLSHDDLYYPNKIKRQVEELCKLEDKNTIIMSELNGINENKERIYQTEYLAHMKEHPSREESFIYPVVYNKTHGCTLLIPKACFDEVGLFDPKERVAQDFEFFYRAFSKFPSKLVAETLVTARDTSNRMGRRAKPRAIKEYSRLYMKIIDGLSEKDILMLARDRLSFYYDMHVFFRDAGYTIALDYINKKIENHLPEYADYFIDKLTDGRDVNLAGFESKVDTMVKVSEIKIHNHADTKNKMDLTLFSSLRSRFVDNKIKLALDLSAFAYKLLNSNGFKRTASMLLCSLVASEPQEEGLLKDFLAESIIGKDKTVKSDVDVLLKHYLSKKTKPRIMFCSTHWLTGGMERVMANLFGQLAKKYEIFLITPFDGRSGLVKLPDGVRHLKVSNEIFYSDFDGSVLSHAMLLKVDIIVGFYNLFEKQLSIYRNCYGTNIKTIASNHEYFFYPYRNNFFADVIQDRLDTFSLVDAVIWPTNISAAIYGLHGSNSYVIPNPNTFKVASRCSVISEKNIIAVGRFGDYIKRIDRLFQTFALVLDQEPDTKLILVGKYDTTEPIDGIGLSIVDLMVEHRIDESSVMFVGEINNVEKYYKKSKLLVMTSNNEGFGMVINEAASFGVPSVCSYFPGIEDLLVDGENGFIVEQGDNVSMANRICQILSDSKLQDSLSKKAKSFVGGFDAEKIGAKWDFLFSTLLRDISPSETRVLLENKISYIDPGCGPINQLLFEELNLIAENSRYGADSLRLKELYDSRSWKITKPLRIISKLRNSLRESGIRVTFKKITKKIKKSLS